MSKKILIINAGSSSIKFKLFEKVNYHVIASGLCERIFVDGQFTMKYGDNKVFQTNTPMPDHTKATEYLLNQLKDLHVIEDFNDIIGVGHRVVLCTPKITSSVAITPIVKADIQSMTKLAPLHNGPELTVIDIFEKLLPHAMQVASFDNTFHATIPPENYTYPINQEIAKKYAIRRYGFHGNSYRFITKRMSALLNKQNPNLIVCHLGNGASVCAIKEGKSFDTSMGLTPLEGVMMGTRSGNVDPSIVTYLIREGMSVDQVDNLLNKESGLKGVFGSPDMREVSSAYEKNNKNAQLAFTMYANRVVEYILKYANELENKVDALVFTAGVGENSTFLIQHVVNKIKLLELKLNKNLNEKYDDYKLISDTSSTYPIYCVRTDEELMIAQDVISNLKPNNA
jgi:acetate kinase